jgi:hypothetical protein
MERADLQPEIVTQVSTGGRFRKFVQLNNWL